jgi:hypothetical protein
MGSNPVVLGVRFLLEVVGLYAFGLWGWYVGSGGFAGLVLAIGLPLIVAVIWAVFGAKDDKARGAPVVAVPGKVRLVIELIVFVTATLAFFAAQAQIAGLIYGVVALLQNLVAYDRIGWLLSH